MKNQTFAVYIEQDEDGIFIGSIPSLPSCHAEGKTLEEMLKELKDVAKLCQRNHHPEKPMRFVGIQNLEIANA